MAVMARYDVFAVWHRMIGQNEPNSRRHHGSGPKCLEKACKDFTVRIEPLGFRRTRKMFWIRRHPHTVDFIHFHRSGSSYGKPINYSVRIRVHFGIRVLNDDSQGAALNGPFSDPGRLRTGDTISDSMRNQAARTTDVLKIWLAS